MAQWINCLVILFLFAVLLEISSTLDYLLLRQIRCNDY